MIVRSHDSLKKVLNIVSSRICNYTFGVSLSIPFQTGKHPESKRYTWDNEQWCRHIFHTCFNADEVVKIGDMRQIELNDTFETADSQSRRTHPYFNRFIF
jgi:hypothetical protein